MQFSSGSFAMANNQLHVMCAVSFGAEYQQNGPSFRKKKQKNMDRGPYGPPPSRGQYQGFLPHSESSRRQNW